MTAFGIQPGDIYCPSSPPRECQVEMVLSRSGYWQCNRHGAWNHPFEITPDGRFNWVWSDENPPPGPGCPWCDSRNYVMEDSIYDGMWWFRCQRQSCGRNWVGNWTRQGDWKTDKWTIRMSVDRVTWASGTFADLECHRRSQLCQMFASACCRWPKSCRAYDPGFAIGKGPTRLPIIWNDGFGWRSGPPDPLTTPQHLWNSIWGRWALTIRERGLLNDDDDGCGQGCEYICYHE